jgi:E3 ubiquitin-protein ligase Arkadia
MLEEIKMVMFDMWMEHHVDHVVEELSTMMEDIPNVIDFVRTMNQGNPSKKATEKEISSLNTYEYGSKEFKEHVEKHVLKPLDTCSICLTEFEEGEDVKFTKCNHLFHSGDCLDKWLKENVYCPLCRCNSITGVAKDEEIKQPENQDDEHLEPSLMSGEYISMPREYNTIPIPREYNYMEDPTLNE